MDTVLDNTDLEAGRNPGPYRPVLNPLFYLTVHISAVFMSSSRQGREWDRALERVDCSGKMRKKQRESQTQPGQALFFPQHRF